MGVLALYNHVTFGVGSWAGNKVAMWRTADPPTRVQIPPRPLKKNLKKKLSVFQINNDISHYFQPFTKQP